MVLTDKNTTLVEAQVLAGASVVSTNVIDMLAPGTEWGTGNSFGVLFVITTTVTGATGATFEIIAASDDALTTNIAVLGSSGFCPVANLIAAANPQSLAGRLQVNANPQLIARLVGPTLGDESATGYQGVQRYLGVRVVGTGAFTGGAFTATVVEGIAADSTLKNYPSGFIVR